MILKFEYPQIRELHIQKIEVIDQTNKVVSSFQLNCEELLWHTEINVDESVFSYKLCMNDSVMFNDPYAHEYTLIGNQLWSVRYRDKEAIEVGKEVVNAYEVVVSKQMSHSVQKRHMQKIFYFKIDPRVNVGVELKRVYGLHELIVVWYSPNHRMHHIQYEMVHPEVEGEYYGIIYWFKMVLEDVEKEIVEGIWEIQVLFDGEIIDYEQIEIRGKFYGYCSAKQL